MGHIASLLFLGLAALLTLANAQCPNQVAIYNPALRTQTSNSTWFLVPIKKAAVQTALDAVYGQGNVVLGDVPSSDKTLFPLGFSADYHPVLANVGYSDDIRMSVFQIDGALLGSTVYATYVRRPTSKSGTVLSAELSGYLAGPDGQSLPGLVPGTVSTLVEGFPQRAGLFKPNDAAYQLNAGGVLSSASEWNVAPNPVSGPGVAIEAVDLQFQALKKYTKTTAKLFKAVLNQPAILAGVYLANNTCQRDQFYFNNATGVMLPRAGNVTFGPAADGQLQTTGSLQKASPDGSGFYAGQEGFSACGQNVGFNPEDCDAAAQNVDRAAL